MEHQQLREIILKELPILIQNDRNFRKTVLKITRRRFANKAETESRFDRLMDDLVQNRILLERKMAEDHQKWEANQQELRTLREEQQRKWEANQQELRTLREEQQRRWEANDRKWEENQKELKDFRAEQQRKWEENQKQHDGLSIAIRDLNRKFDQTLGALGTRWGLHSEESFRNALAGILTQEFPGVEVTRLIDYDAEGVVFGHPDQIDLDLIVKDGRLLIAEIKSSVTKSEMYTFERKVRFYERKYARQVNRLIVISPMVDDYAKPVADKLGIEVYSYAEKVRL
jgi:hypothetical protein